METADALQQLLDMVGNAGDGAFTLAVLYILKGYFAGALFAGTVIVISFQCAKLIRMFHSDRQVLRTICGILGAEDGRGCPLNYEGYGSDKRAVLEAVRSRV